MTGLAFYYGGGEGNLLGGYTLAARGFDSWARQGLLFGDGGDEEIVFF